MDTTMFTVIASSAEHGGKVDYIHMAMHFAMQLAVILVAAKLVGEVFERYLKQPAVLGELIAGVIIGPYMLGMYMNIPVVGQLFPLIPGQSIPVGQPLYGFAQMAAVILLFLAGLETDLKKFIRYGFVASVVALGGVVPPFVLGAMGTVWFGFADSFMDPSALFMGAIMTATSVGITARVLSELKKIDTPEGVTILGAAVLDDVLGILILAIVIGMAGGSKSGGQTEPFVKTGTVAVYAVEASDDGALKTDRHVGEGSILPSGFLQLELEHGFDGPALIKVLEGEYFDMFDHKRWKIESKVASFAVLVEKLNENSDLSIINIDPISTLAAAYLEHVPSLGEPADEKGMAKYEEDRATYYVSKANSVIAGYFSLQKIPAGRILDIGSEEHPYNGPLDLNAKAAYLHGGIATVADKLGVSIPELTRGLSLDVKDGIFDGKKSGSPIALQGTTKVLDDEVAAEKLADAITRFATTASAHSNISAVELEPIGNRLRKLSGPLAEIQAEKIASKVDWGKIGMVAVKALGFWLGLTIIGVILAPFIAKILRWFHSPGASIAMALALCFGCAALAEMFGLAMIIGAYSIGLALSGSEIKHYLEDNLRPISNTLVPVFFCVMGMLCNIGEIAAGGMAVLGFGAVISIFAIISKVFGCGLPALWPGGFNKRGALRVGIGMLPRGEVALIVAGVGLAAGAISQIIFMVAIIMTMVTTLMAPMILVPIFRTGGPGKTEEEPPEEPGEIKKTEAYYKG